MNINNINRMRDFIQQKSCGTGANDWNIIPHKGMKSPSYDEMIKQAKELGARAASGSPNEQKQIDAEYERLNAQFMSLASPDRKKLYKEAMEEINKHSSSKKSIEEPKPLKNLIDYLNEHDGIGSGGMKTDKPYPLKSGGTVTAYGSGVGGKRYDVQHNGETVMVIENGNIEPRSTAAEFALHVQLHKIFTDALRSTRDNTNENISMNSVIGNIPKNTAANGNTSDSFALANESDINSLIYSARGVNTVDTDRINRND